MSPMTMDRRARVPLGVGLLAVVLGACVGPGPVAPPTVAPPTVAPASTERVVTAGPPPTAGPTADLSDVPTCDTPQTAALGLGVKQFQSEAETRAQLGDAMLYPDPATLPAGSKLVESYYNAGIVRTTNYKQSTMAMTYQVGDEKKYIQILYYSTLNPFQTPQEPHEATTVRGGKPAFQFDVPFSEGQHSVWWQEGCRQVSVIADLPVEDVLRIVEGLSTAAPATEQ